MLKIPFWRRKRFWIFSGLLVAVIALGFWHVWRTPTPLPLPTDEEIIAHFKAHRAEFEELVRLHRTFAEREHWPELKWPNEEKSVKELMKKAEINDLNYLSLGRWLPDPYKQATAERWQSIDDQCTQDVKRWRAKDGEKNKIPPPKCRLNGYRYGVLYFKLDPHNSYYSSSFRYVTVWKQIIHFPEPPRIENGYLLGPMQKNGQYMYKERAFTSLNHYPADWKEYESVYRSIDAHWYIVLGNGH